MRTIQWLKKKIVAKGRSEISQDHTEISNDQTNMEVLRKHTEIYRQIGIACHDLNTPLATLEIVASLIKNKINSKEYELLVSAIQKIREVSTGLAKSRHSHVNNK